VRSLGRAPGSEHVLHVVVQVKPPNKREDVSVEVSVVPFRIVLVPQWVSAVSGFFQVSEEARLGVDLATDALFEWSESKQLDLVEALARRTLIALQVHVQEPIIALPLVATKHSLPMVILDLGDFFLVSDDPRLKGQASLRGGSGGRFSGLTLARPQTTADDSGVGLALDAWQLNLHRVRARLVTQELVTSGAWQTVFDRDDLVGYFALLDEFDLAVHLAVCVTPAALQVAKTRLQLSATALKLHAPPSLLAYAADLGVSWSGVLAGGGAAGSAQSPERAQEDAELLAERPALLQVNVSVDALVVTFARHDARALCRVELCRFLAQHSRKPTGEAHMQLSLGSAQAFDLFSATPPLMATSFVSERQDSRVISVDVHWAPDATKVDATFDELHVNWNPETVAEIKEAYAGRTAAGGGAAPRARASPAAAPPVAAATAGRASRKTVQLNASLNTLSVALCKGASGRTLSQVVVSGASLFVQRDGGRHSWFRAKLGRLACMQPASSALSPSTPDVQLFASDPRASGEALFTIDFSTKAEDAIHDAVLSCGIGPAKLVYSQQMWMELVDYIYEGVLGAIFMDLTERAGEVVAASRTSAARWRASLDWLSPVVLIPTTPLGLGHEHMELACSQIRAFNSFTPPAAGPAGADAAGVAATTATWSMLTKVHLSHATVNGVVGGTSARLLVHPVAVDLDVVQPVGAAATKFRRDVKGSVSAIEISLPREQYFLVHRMLNGNLLSEPPKPAAAAGGAAAANAQQQRRVSYEYDREDVPPTPFNVQLEFCLAKLRLSDERGTQIATFAMRQAVVGLDRPAADGVVTNTLRVQYLELVDDRPVSHARCFRHLILCDTSSDTLQPAFEVVYVSERAQVSIDLHTFRSAVMLDLFWSVLDFVTTTAPPASPQLEDPQPSPQPSPLPTPVPGAQDAAAPSATPAKVVPWHGTFRLRGASMFLLCDLTSPSTDAVVLGGDLDLEWRRREDGSASTWNGVLKGFELYRATLPLAAPGASADQSRAALLRPVVGSQIVEPADTGFAYSYEQDPSGQDTKIHTRHVSVRLEQLEMFLSISDMAAMLAVARGLTRGDGPALGSARSSSGGGGGSDFFRVAPQVKVWQGQRSDMPLNEPTPASVQHARRKLGARRFTVEVASPRDLRHVELLEHEGFVTVATVPRDCALAHLLAPGDVVVALDYAPVTQKSPRFVRALIEDAPEDVPLTVTLHPAGCPDPLVLKDTLEVNGGVVVLHLIDDIHERDLPLVGGDGGAG
jgi:hypothetical protein